MTRASTAPVRLVRRGSHPPLPMSGAGDRPMPRSVARPRAHRSGDRRSSSRRRADRLPTLIGRLQVLGQGPGVGSGAGSAAPSHRARVPPMSQDDREFPQTRRRSIQDGGGRRAGSGAHDRPRRPARRGGRVVPSSATSPGRVLGAPPRSHRSGPSTCRARSGARSPHPNIGRSEDQQADPRSRGPTTPTVGHQLSPLRRSAPPGPQWQPTSGRRPARNRPRHRAKGRSRRCRSG